MDPFDEHYSSHSTYDQGGAPLQGAPSSPSETDVMFSYVDPSFISDAGVGTAFDNDTSNAFAPVEAPWVGNMFAPNTSAVGMFTTFSNPFDTSTTAYTSNTGGGPIVPSAGQLFTQEMFAPHVSQTSTPFVPTIHPSLLTIPAYNNNVPEPGYEMSDASMSTILQRSLAVVARLARGSRGFVPDPDEPDLSLTTRKLRKSKFFHDCRERGDVLRPFTSRTLSFDVQERVIRDSISPKRTSYTFAVPNFPYDVQWLCVDGTRPDEETLMFEGNVLLLVFQCELLELSLVGANGRGVAYGELCAEPISARSAQCITEIMAMYTGEVSPKSFHVERKFRYRAPLTKGPFGKEFALFSSVYDTLRISEGQDDSWSVISCKDLEKRDLLNVTFYMVRKAIPGDYDVSLELSMIERIYPRPPPPTRTSKS